MHQRYRICDTYENRPYIATEHRVWVAVASFAGSTGDGYVRSAGCSGIWACDGAVPAQAGPETGAIARATLS